MSRNEYLRIPTGLLDADAISAVASAAMPGRRQERSVRMFLVTLFGDGIAGTALAIPAVRIT